MAEFIDFVDMRLNDPDLEAIDGTPRRVDPGPYDFEVVKAAFDQSRKGNRTLVVSAAVVTEGPMKGRTMRQSYVIDPNSEFARARMKSLIDATGIMLDDQGRFSKESLVGTRFFAEVILNEFDDVDARTGQTVRRETTKWIGERPVEQVQATPPARQAAPAASRRPAPPANGGQAVRR